jgi:hypothetical protein
MLGKIRAGCIQALEFFLFELLGFPAVMEWNFTVDACKLSMLD